MKKEIKYLLFSFPAIYLLLVIVSIFLSVVVDPGKCTEFAAFSYARECGFGELVLTSFTNAFLLSLYFFPLYIVIPLITFFTSRHFIRKNQPVPASQPDANSRKSLNITKSIIGIFVVIIIYLAMSLWSASQGFSIFRLVSRNHLDPKSGQQISTIPYDTQNSNIQTPAQKQLQAHPENQNQQVDETINWKTYGSDYGFKFKYPTDYSLDAINPQKVELRSKSNNVTDFYGNKTQADIIIEYFGDITQLPHYQAGIKNIDDYMAQNGSAKLMYNITSYKNSSGFLVYSFTDTGLKSIYTELIAHNNHYYQISFTTRETGDQLSTEEKKIQQSFKFIK